MPSQGEGRCLLSAGSDREAIDAWLEAVSDSDGKPRSTATRRSYRKEAERLLLWAVLVRRNAISSLEEKDVQAYRDFLSEPPSDWCGPRHVQRWSPRWRPLEGPLSSAAIGQALTILHGLFAFWVHHAYVKTNPFAAPAVRRPSSPKPTPSRTILPSDWAQLEALLEQGTPTTQGRRVVRAMRWLRFSDLGLVELTKVRCEHLRRAQGSHSDSEWLIVLDDTPRSSPRMPIPMALVEEFQAELRRHGRLGDVTAPDNRGVHILARFQSQAGPPPPWSASGLAKAIRAAFDRVAARAEGSGAQRWAQASARSLRAQGQRRPVVRHEDAEQLRAGRADAVVEPGSTSRSVVLRPQGTGGPIRLLEAPSGDEGQRVAPDIASIVRSSAEGAAG